MYARSGINQSFVEYCIVHAYVSRGSTTLACAAFDLIVVGGGPGGYVAAIKAGQLGLKVSVRLLPVVSVEFSFRVGPRVAPASHSPIRTTIRVDSMR